MGLVEELLMWLRLRPRILGEVRVPRAEELKSKYIEGLSRAIGVKPEEIREEIVERWLTHWLRAIIKPEYWEKYGLA